MPNGIDKTLERLTIAAAVYRTRFADCPTHARCGPEYLWDLGQILDANAFGRLAGLMELRTQRDGISVGGRMGVQPYNGALFEQIPHGAVEAARRWLDLSLRPGLENY